MTFAPVAFAECVEEERFGGKVVSLGAALRANLPTPPGYGVEVELVNAVVSGDTAALSTVRSLFDAVKPSCAVRFLPPATQPE